MLYSEYEKWMLSLGSKFNKIALHFFHPDYRGVIAKRKIYKGDEIVIVPRDGMITLSMAKKAPIGAKMVAANISLIYPNNSFLSSYVIYERAQPTSKWKYFFDCLPKSVDNFPVFFTKEELDMLKGSTFLHAIQELRDDMAKDYKRICEAAPEFRAMATVDDFMKTRALVNSRIFGTKIDKLEDDSIVPYADMFNYKFKSDMTHWTFSEEKKSFVIKAKDNIKRGEEIYVYYGNKPNTNFFMFYGFVIENNENDEVILNISLKPSDSLKGIKQSLLDRESDPRKMKISESAEDQKFQKMMSYLRFVEFAGTEAFLRDVIRNFQEFKF